MKPLAILKLNIDTLLKSRGFTRRDLASWVRQSTNKRLIDPWISHVFRNVEQDIPAKYLERIADFLGVDVYMLFQPGLSAATDRRKSERRVQMERRVTRNPLRPLEPTDGEFLQKLRKLSVEERVRVFHLMDGVLLGRSESRTKGGRRDHEASS